MAGAAFVEYAGTLTPSDTFSTPDPGKPLYSAFKIDADGTVEFYDQNGDTIPSSEYLGGQWHFLLFAGVRDTGTEATSVQAGWIKNSDLHGLSNQGFTPLA
jgi:hypothetical protein